MLNSGFHNKGTRAVLSFFAFRFVLLLLLLLVVLLSFFDFVRAQPPFEFTYPILSVQTGNVLYLRLKKVTFR